MGGVGAVGQFWIPTRQTEPRKLAKIDRLRLEQLRANLFDQLIRLSSGHYYVHGEHVTLFRSL